MAIVCTRKNIPGFFHRTCLLHPDDLFCSVYFHCPCGLPAYCPVGCCGLAIDAGGVCAGVEGGGYGERDTVEPEAEVQQFAAYVLAEFEQFSFEGFYSSVAAEVHGSDDLSCFGDFGSGIITGDCYDACGICFG